MTTSLVALALCVLVAPDSPGMVPEPLHPRDYLSPSGEWVLHVDPTERGGAGPARYVMTRSGAPVWRREHPFTFQDAAITDDGTSVGYAATAGLPLEGTPEGEVVLAVLGSDGSVRGAERELLVYGRTDTWPYPTPTGFAVFMERDTAVLRVADPSAPRLEWWTISLSTGETRRGAERPDFVPDLPVPIRPVLAELLPFEPASAARVAIEIRGRADLRARDLRRPSLLAVDGTGRAWCAERGVVRAFDRDGLELVELRSGAVSADRGRARAPQWIAFRADGTVLVARVAGVDAFTADGTWLERAGERQHLRAQLLFPSDGAGHWEVDAYAGRIRRVLPDASVRVVERGANRRWLRYPDHAALAADGSLAVLDSTYSPAGYYAWVHVFDRAGEALSSRQVPSGCSAPAFDGRRVALACEERVLVFDALGAAPLAVLAWEPAAEVRGLAFAPDGELLVLAGTTLHRLFLP